MITVPNTDPSFLISPKIQDTTLTINFKVTTQKWCSTCHAILTVLSGAATSLTCLLLVLQSVNISHHLFLSSKKSPPTYDKANQ